MKKKIFEYRYGTMNLRTPTRDMVYEAYTIPRMRQPKKRRMFENVVDVMIRPPFHLGPVRYHSFTKNTHRFLDDFNKQPLLNQRRVIGNIIDHHLAAKALYMLERKSRYHGFENFHQTWFYNFQLALRTYSFGRAYERGDLKTSNSGHPASCKFFYLPFSLPPNQTEILASLIFEIVYPRIKSIAKYNGVDLHQL